MLIILRHIQFHFVTRNLDAIFAINTILKIPKSQQQHAYAVIHQKKRPSFASISYSRLQISRIKSKHIPLEDSEIDAYLGIIDGTQCSNLAQCTGSQQPIKVAQATTLSQQQTNAGKPKYVTAQQA